MQLEHIYIIVPIVSINSQMNDIILHERTIQFSLWFPLEDIEMRSSSKFVINMVAGFAIIISSVSVSDTFFPLGDNIMHAVCSTEP